MARLPQPGGDQGTWGEVLNEFLSQSHNGDGSLKDVPQSKVTGLIADLAAKEPAGLSTETRNELNDTITAAIAPIVSTSLLRAPTPRTASTAKRIIQGFAPGHGWVVSGAGVASSNVNDTSDFFFGTQSIRATSTAGGAMKMTKAGLALDLTNSDLRLFFKYDSAAALSYLRLYLTDNAQANGRYIDVLNLVSTSDGKGYTVLPDGWAVVDIPYSQIPSVVGSGISRNNIDTIYLVWQAKAGQSLVAHFAGLDVVPTPDLWPNGVVSITCDDSFDGQWSILRPALDMKGWKATFFPIIQTLGSGSYFSLNALKSLRDQGHEIGAHATSPTAHTTGIASLSTEARRAELEKLRQFGAENGFNLVSYAYPNGDWSVDAEVDVARYFNSGRLGFANYPGLAKPTNEFHYRAVNVGTQYAQVTTLLDRTKAAKGWMVLVLHNIVPSGASGNDITTDQMNIILNYIESQGIAVQPVSVVMAAAVR